jgi:hypothetical protein
MTATTRTLQGYASRTGTRRNLAVLREAGWRLLVAAQGVHRSEGFRYMLDNSAFTYWTHDIVADWSDTGNAGAPFLRLLAALGGTAEVDQVVAPDIVCGGEASLVAPPASGTTTARPQPGARCRATTTPLTTSRSSASPRAPSGPT